MAEAVKFYIWKISLIVHLFDVFCDTSRSDRFAVPLGKDEILLFEVNAVQSIVTVADLVTYFVLFVFLSLSVFFESFHHRRKKIDLPLGVVGLQRVQIKSNITFIQ